MADLLKQQAGFFRRSAALIYDALLLFAAFFLVTAIAIWLNEGENVPGAWLRWFFLVTMYLFFSWFWLHGGQTLGMRAWRLRLQRIDGQPITIWQALLRFMVAIPSLALAGLGLLWILVDKDKLAWHDRFSESMIVRLPKK